MTTTIIDPQSVLTPECVNDCRTTVPRDDRHHHTCQWASPNLGTAWCPQDRRRVTVEDQFTAGHMERHGEVEYHVTALACGHQLTGQAHVVTTAPGAPYAPGAYATIRDSRSWGELVRRARVADPFAAAGEPPF